MAQAHTGVYYGGTANLLAFEDTEKHRIGSDEALEALDDKIRLQSWLNQVAQVEQLFEPLAEPLSRMHRAASDMNDVDGRAFTRVCTDEPEEPPPVVVEAQPPVVESTALAVVPGSPADESYDFFGGSVAAREPGAHRLGAAARGRRRSASTCPSGGRGGRPCRACPGRCSTSSMRRRSKPGMQQVGDAHDRMPRRPTRRRSASAGGSSRAVLCTCRPRRCSTLATRWWCTRTHARASKTRPLSSRKAPASSRALRRGGPGRRTRADGAAETADRPSSLSSASD